MERSGVGVPLLVLVHGALCQSSGDVCHVTQGSSNGMCSSVELLFGSPSRVHLTVLQELCQKGQQHVLAKGGGEGTFGRSSPFVESRRRAEQFAVINLHRDIFSDKVSWTSGDAHNVICDGKWYVDDEVALTNSYSWYRQALPLWPLLNQALAPKSSRFSRQKKLDWPNYAIATPLYLVPHENSNLRDPKIAFQKLFAGDAVHSQDKISLQNVFAHPANFQKDVVEFYEEKSVDIIQDTENYTNWLIPLVKRSLRPMVESFKARQKKRAPKQSEVSLCPDELYVFFLRKPCADVSSCQLLHQLQLVLRTVGCSAITNAVVGFSRE